VFASPTSGAAVIDGLVSHDWEAVGVDAVVEDPFADAADLTGAVDLAGLDVVLTIGGGSVTAIAIAVLADVPLTPLGTVEPRRLHAIDAAIGSGAAVHRPVADLCVDGVRRLVTGPIEVHSHRPVDALLDDVRTVPVHADTTVRIAAELPTSGRLTVYVDGQPSRRAERLRVRSPGAPARLAASPRAQLFTELDVRLHARHLRELLLS
jgi:hypothetical protein